MNTVSFTPSTNIIRDADRALNYIPTTNAIKIAEEIGNGFKKGTSAFTIIGSYGTGKSSFIWAFEQSLRGGNRYFNPNLEIHPYRVDTLNIVGQYQSIIKHFEEQLGVETHASGFQVILDAIHQIYEQNDLLVIAIDEFGKFLEYASRNNPERELYFIQELAEFVNAQGRNIILLTTLHQSFEAYSAELNNEAQKQEWRKVKGRFQELTFNEPVEQLLYLAAERFKQKFPSPDHTGTGFFTQLLNKHSVFAVDYDILDKVHEDLYPLDPISAIILTQALQQYGQNERSLFTFLETADEATLGDSYFNLPKVYDYLISQFYAFLNTPFNPHYRHWAVLQNALERVEIEFEEYQHLVSASVKTVGLLQVFASRGASINEKFLVGYLQPFGYKSAAIKRAIKKLHSKKIFHYTKFNEAYKVYEGTDLDFDEEIIKAGQAIDENFSIVSLLEEHFELPVITAKATTYKTGTPRLFDFVISEEPKTNLNPRGPKDGFINLIFSESLDLEALKEQTNNQDQPVLYGFFHQTQSIKDCLLDIQKTKKVKQDNNEDTVARRELDNILQSHEKLLRHRVLDALYTDQVSWVFQGQELANITSKKQLNQQLSTIAETIYHKAPKFNNELVNKDNVSSSIHTARKNFFNSLVYHWPEADLGHPENKFPAEKTIYLTLLQKNSMHVQLGDGYELKAPDPESSFYPLWKASEEFFESARTARRSIKDLYRILQVPPFKLKQGLADFWIPTYLFIKRGDYALFEEGTFVPELSDAYLHAITRNPQDYEIKVFQFDDLRLQVFNKYQELIEKEPAQKLSTNTFLETIKPFLSFYQGLTDYAKQTKKLSAEAVALRNAIAQSTDPEKAFFQDFPKALGLDLHTLANSDDELNRFALTLNNAIDEIKNAYVELLNRIEQFIKEEIAFTQKDFPAYKEALQSRFQNLKEHQVVKHQKVLLERINAPLDDRDSWLVSVGQAMLKKPLDRISDQEEEVFKDQLRYSVEELDNLKAISETDDEVNSDSASAQTIRLNLTTQGEGMTAQNVYIPEEKKAEIDRLANKVKAQLSGSANLKKAILAKLIKEELDNE